MNPKWSLFYTQLLVSSFPLFLALCQCSPLHSPESVKWSFCVANSSLLAVHCGYLCYYCSISRIRCRFHGLLLFFSVEPIGDKDGWKMFMYAYIISFALLVVSTVSCGALLLYQLLHQPLLPIHHFCALGFHAFLLARSAVFISLLRHPQNKNEITATLLVSQAGLVFSFVVLLAHGIQTDPVSQFFLWGIVYMNIHGAFWECFWWLRIWYSRIGECWRICNRSGIGTVEKNVQCPTRNVEWHPITF